MSHHEAPAVVPEQFGVCVQVGPALRLQRHRDHLASGQSAELVQIRLRFGRTGGHESKAFMRYPRHQAYSSLPASTGDSGLLYPGGYAALLLTPPIPNFWV